MSALEILILDCNDLLPLTINSIKKNMPRMKYSVVKCGNSKVGTALAYITKPTLVVTSGLVLNIKQGDLPDANLLDKYDICVSRAGVYCDHPKLKNVYELVDSPITKGHIDLSIFILNPTNWNTLVKSDTGLLNGRKILYMPRYVNHKHDVIIKDCVGSYQAFNYGMAGEAAAVLNYLPHLLSGEATPVETYAYCFDKVGEYTEGLSDEAKARVLGLANKTRTRIAKMRKALWQVKQGVYNGTRKDI